MKSVEVSKEIELLQNCMNENLNHARHVENERLSFLQAYLVLVGIVGALITNDTLHEKNWVLLLLIFLVFISGVFAIALTMRWNKVFEAHRTCAIDCYLKLYKLVYMDEQEAITEYKDEKTGNSEDSPLFCFTFNFSSGGKERTGKRFCIFYKIVTSFVGILLLIYFIKYWAL